MEEVEVWLARDMSGALCIYTTIPHKKKYGWSSLKAPIGACNRDSFPSIKWEDKEPTKAKIILEL